MNDQFEMGGDLAAHVEDCLRNGDFKMPAVIYYGKRTKDGTVQVTYQRSGGASKPFKPLRHVKYHSPDGFEYGYSGSGPSDLALSILAHHLGETWVNGPYLKRLKITQEAPLCWKFHQDFKRDVIAALAGDIWQITSDEVHDWLMKQEKPEDKKP